MHTLSQAFPKSFTVLSWFDFSLLCLLLGGGSSLMGSEFLPWTLSIWCCLTPDLYWTWTFRGEPPHSHNHNLIVSALAVRTSVANVFISDHTVGTELVTWTDWFIVWLDVVFGLFFFLINWLTFLWTFLHLVPSYMLPSLNIISSHLTPQIYAVLSRWLEAELRPHAAFSRESDFQGSFHLLILLERGLDRQKTEEPSDTIQSTYLYTFNEWVQVVGSHARPGLGIASVRTRSTLL